MLETKIGPDCCMIMYHSRLSLASVKNDAANVICWGSCEADDNRLAGLARPNRRHYHDI